MSHSDDIVAAVRRAQDSPEPHEVAMQLVYAASVVIKDDDQIARVFLAKTMMKVAHQLDPDVDRCLTTQ